MAQEKTVGAIPCNCATAQVFGDELLNGLPP
jgi:hypothetical protein